MRVDGVTHGAGSTVGGETWSSSGRRPCGAACAELSPGHVGADFVEPGAMKGARKEVACPAGTRVRSSLVGLAMVSVCEPCANGTVSGPASSNCTACAFGSYSNKERTMCLEMVKIMVEPSSNGTSGDTSLVGQVVTAAAEGKFGGQTAALAFFCLLGVCALFFGVAAGMYRRRQRRLQALAGGAGLFTHTHIWSSVHSFTHHIWSSVHSFLHTTFGHLSIHSHTPTFGHLSIHSHTPGSCGGVYSHHKIKIKPPQLVSA